MKRFFYLNFLSLLTQPVWAADKASSWSTGNTYMDILMIVFILFALLVLVVALTLLRTVNLLSQHALHPNQKTVTKEVAEPVAPMDYHEWKTFKKAQPTFFAKVMGLRPISEEKDIELEHQFDGITELDNPIPGWFMFLFYGTILFGSLYLLNYHVFHWGMLQDQEYVVEMKQADIAKKAFLSKAANAVDENNVKLVNDGATLTAGVATFKANCVACHGDHAQGVVGPNLTDEFWLHGSKINQVFKTIKYGVLDKGMPTWEKTLTPKQIADVANYVVSLKGSHPANPKAPQGEKE
ncbi:MAG: cbb3-type cytochrome c oxidase N-terminal domain-containing protein [Janthinobacterium lividum]